MTPHSGSSAWAVLRLRNEAGLIRERRKLAAERGYALYQVNALSDAAGAADRMAASVEAGDRRSFRQNWREFDKFVSFAGSATDYGWKPGNTPVDKVAARWELDMDEETKESKESEDRPRHQGAEHRVRGFEREVEGRRERVRPHVARNPRRR